MKCRKALGGRRNEETMQYPMKRKMKETSFELTDGYVKVYLDFVIGSWVVSSFANNMYSLINQLWLQLEAGLDYC